MKQEGLSDRITVTSLMRYPVKGFTGETLDSVRLETDGIMPFDRAYAIENGPSGFATDAPRTLPKVKFLCLMRNPDLAALTTRFDAETERFTVRTPDGREISGTLAQDGDATELLTFLADHVGDKLRGPLNVLSAQGHSFSDVALRCVHIVNLASVRDLEQRLGRPIDPLRFRPNILIDGLAAWLELDCVGDGFLAPSGLKLEIVERTERCAATRANPNTGDRDIDIPRELMRLFGHDDFGVYATVSAPGTLAVGHTLRLDQAPASNNSTRLPF
ncbi:MAG: MOSC N-terminal beta barrel domain-containing protein [Pseudomonadota bacterium]